MTEVAHITQGTVVVSDDALLISDVLETDPVAVEFVKDSDDPVDATRRCIRIGARAIQAASATIDSETVSNRFEALNADFQASVSTAVDRIASIANELLSEDGGGLSVAYTAHRDQLSALLDDRFDPDSKSSVMAQIDKLVTDSISAQNADLKRLISLDTPDGPLRVLKSELVDGVTGPISKLHDQVRDLSEKVAVNAAIAPVIAVSTSKGFTFEDLVHDQVSEMAARHGDSAEQTGHEVGSAGTKKGDEVVDVNTDDTLGVERCFVLEAKTRKLGVRATHDELDAALENRNALAAIAVFDDQSKAPTSTPFHYSGNKAIVVFDDDHSSLRLAYMWARWVVRRESAVGIGDSIDHERIAELLAGGQRAIERHTTIKRNHSQARNCIEQASTQVAEMAGSVESMIADLETELSGH